MMAYSGKKLKALDRTGHDSCVWFVSVKQEPMEGGRPLRFDYQQNAPAGSEAK
jgi:hypothetical protein